MSGEPAFEKISSKTLRHAVYLQLRERIISGKLLPGQSISLRNIAEQLGVSISPVRDAVWQLESEKILVVESNKSIRVNSLDAEEMQEALNIRLLLETQAAEAACELRSEESLPQIKSLLKALNGSIRKPRRYVELNSRFHFAIYSSANSPLLLGILNGLWARIVPYFFLYVSKSEDLARTIAFHTAMYEAIESRQKKKIVDALHADLETAAAIIIPILRELRG
jgi:DNA-binding GntR family transcriptional regulator